MVQRKLEKSCGDKKRGLSDFLEALGSVWLLGRAASSKDDQEVR
jgi:hypothetical protein